MKKRLSILITVSIAIVAGPLQADTLEFAEHDGDIIDVF